MEVLTIQPYERPPEDQSYQYPSLEYKGKIVIIGSESQEETLYDWVDIRSKDARFLCNERMLTIPLDVNRYLLHRSNVSKSRKEEIHKMTEKERRRTAIEKYFERNSGGVLYKDRLDAVRITIQRGDDNQFIYSDRIMPPRMMHRLFTERHDLEVKRFASLLPDGCGLDGFVVSGGFNHRELILDVHKRRRGYNGEIVLSYVITDIMSLDIPAIERMKILKEMKRRYISRFGRLHCVSIIKHAVISSRRELLDYMTRSKCSHCIVEPLYGLYIPGANRDLLKIRNYYCEDVEDEQDIINSARNDPNSRAMDEEEEDHIELKRLEGLVAYYKDIEEKRRLNQPLPIIIDDKYKQGHLKALRSLRLLKAKIDGKHHIEAEKFVPRDRTEEEIERYKILISLQRIINIIEKIGYKEGSEIDIIETEIFDGPTQPEIIDTEDWNAMLPRYREIQSTIHDNILYINFMIKAACKDIIINPLNIDEDKYNWIQEHIVYRDNYVSILAMNAKTFSFYIKNYILSNCSRNYDNTGGLEAWEKSECYKVKYGVSVDISDYEAKIFNICNYIILRENDISDITDVLLSSSLPMRERYFKIFTETFENQQDMLKSITNLYSVVAADSYGKLKPIKVTVGNI